MQGNGGFTVLMAILAGLLWVKYAYDSSPTSIWLPISVSITCVVSLILWILRRRDE
ncbi:hypothetical protein [Tuwongella immobilis]|uniref:Uncharacterized protein n=1 Tax=Tuwongella immobilis TaxID=692036 RepID=A0A6C2YWF6_9BACT|nr:hypothetical protein [Tuwongella immobilis]VIP05185.1 unnamed protein product [Tuwongella immobilis]VTS07726.1 unnamed protein product [Tuwongella immobilis]